MVWIDESPEIEALLLAMEMAMALTSLLNKRNDNIDRNNSHPPQTSTKSQGMKPPLSILPSTSAPTTLLLLSLNELTPSYNQFPWLKRNKNVSMNNNNMFYNRPSASVLALALAQAPLSLQLPPLLLPLSDKLIALSSSDRNNKAQIAEQHTPSLLSPPSIEVLSRKAPTQSPSSSTVSELPLLLNDWNNTKRIANDILSSSL